MKGNMCWNYYMYLAHHLECTTVLLKHKANVNYQRKNQGEIVVHSCSISRADSGQLQRWGGNTYYINVGEEHENQIISTSDKPQIASEHCP